AGAPGRMQVVATATDADGLTGSSTAEIKVRDPNDQQAPVVSFAPSLSGAVLTGPTAVVGAVTDNNLDSWDLAISRPGDATFTTLAQGETPVAAGVLTTLDATALANGVYVLRLRATDIGGRSSSAEVSLEVDTATKPTQFLHAVTDLSVMLGDTTVDVVRQYDSLTS